MDKAKLTRLIDVLRELPLRRSTESYVNALPLIISVPSMEVQAKL